MRVLLTIAGACVGALVGWGVHGPSMQGAPEVAQIEARLDPVRMDVLPARLTRAAKPAVAYPEPVDAALQRWRDDGRSVQAIRALRDAEEEALAGILERIESLRRQGQGALVQGDLEMAQERWAEAIRLEQGLGLGRPSATTFELRRSLAAAWHERALAHEERGQLEKAWAIWQHATAIDPAHVEGLAGLQRLAPQLPAAALSTSPAVWPPSVEAGALSSALAPR